MSEQTTKQRAGRIVRDYFKRPDRLTSIKHRLALAAFAITVPLIVWGVAVFSSGWKACPASPGPVVGVHAVWENRCDACHQPFTSIHSANRCDTCHGGPVHFKNQAKDENGCATCHVDHLGREASLVHVSDTHCTSCHGQAPRAIQANENLALEGANNGRPILITDFLRDHPLASGSVQQFRPLADRTLKFSHAIHNSLGLTLDPDNPRAFRLRDIQDQVERDRYQQLQGSTDPVDLVQLTCTACHRLDASDFGFGVDKLGFPSGDLAGLPQSPLLPSRAAGGNPLPITYENQCRSCHPLERFDDPLTGDQTPHRVQPAGLRDFLADIYARQVLKNQPPDKPLKVNLRPGRPEEPAVQEARQAIDKLVAEAQPRLAMSRSGCVKCHQFEDDSVPFFERKVRPTRARDVWFRHARFTHISHRAVDCLECHAGAAPGEVGAGQPLIELEAALVPQLGICLKCHSPAREVGGKPLGGARFDCLECHRYHVAGAPLKGIGAADRDPGNGDLEMRLSVEAFLRGKR